MRTMKDKERLLLIVKVFLDLNGPASTSQITDYLVNRCPVRLDSIITPIKVGALLRGHPRIKKERIKNKTIYEVERWEEKLRIMTS